MQDTTIGPHWEGDMSDGGEVRGVGLNYRGAVGYIDHLAPFCVLMDIPLLCCDEVSERFASRYYPGLRIIRKARSELTAEYFADNFDYIAQADLWPVRG